MGTRGDGMCFCWSCRVCGLCFVQSCFQPYRCRGCGGHWCRHGPPAPAAGTIVRCVPGCVVGAAVCVCTGARGDGMCSRGWCCVCGKCLCSLGSNDIDGAGAAAIGTYLVHVPQLRTLGYVVCSAVCAGPRCVLARERGPMACVCARAVVCAACVRAAGTTTVSVSRVRRPLVQSWPACPCCRH